MNSSETLLCSIHRAAEMGRFTLDKLIPSAESELFRGLLESQRDSYSRFYISSDVLLKANGGDDSGLSGMSKAMGGMMTDFQMAADGSDAHIADMLLKGAEKGVREMEDQLAANRFGASDEVLSLASNLRDFLLEAQSDLRKFTREA